MVNRNMLLSITVIAMLTLSAGVAWADEVTSEINYQGRLADSAGNPLTGTYTMTFSLYEAATGGTALDTDVPDVVVTDGLFNTEIDFDQSYFDGRALWLGIKVGTDSEMTPRQEFRPVPYALSLSPGAVIDGSLSGPILKVNTDGANSYGAYAYTTGYDSEGFYAYTTGEDSEGFYAETFGDYSEGVNARTAGEGSEGVYAKTTGKDSPAVYGWSEQDVGVYGKGKEGGYFTTTTAGTLLNLLAGVNVFTAYNFNPGVYAMITGDNSYGAYAYTTGYDSEGFYAYTTGEDSEGFYAETFGDYSEGVNARTAGEGSEGVYARTSGKDSPAVYGYSVQDVGVYGKGKEGGYFTTTTGGTYIPDEYYNPLAGVNVSTAYEVNPGVWVRTRGDYSEGANIMTLGDHSDGVYIITDGVGSEGVKACAYSGIGVHSFGTTYAFYAIGPYGPFTGAHEVKLSADLPENVTPGMIVSVTGETQVRQIDGRNISFSSTLPTVQLSDTPDDSKVFGVLISESPLPEEHWYINDSIEGDRFGIVNALGEGRVWVTDINGDIEAGDYITTSLVAGYGQKQDDDLLHSYTLGKAIESVNWSELTTTVEFNGQTYNAYPIAVVYTSG